MQILRISAFLNDNHVIGCKPYFKYPPYFLASQPQNLNYKLIVKSKSNFENVGESVLFKNIENYAALLQHIQKNRSTFIIFQCPQFVLGLSGKSDRLFDDKMNQINTSCWNNATQNCAAYNQTCITPEISKSEFNLLLSDQECLLHSSLEWSVLKHNVLNNAIVFKDDIWFYDKNKSNQTRPFLTNFKDKFKSPVPLKD